MLLIGAQTAEWSRKSDIEWVYRVAFDKKLKVVREQILGGIQVLGAYVDMASVKRLGFVNPAKTTGFAGRHVGAHPVIYNVGSHHNFASAARTVGQQNDFYHFVPRSEVVYPNPREDLLFLNPWIFKVTERELALRGVEDDRADEYLYLKITGKQNGADSWQPYVWLRNAEEARIIGRGVGAMKHLDKSLWNESMYASIWVGKDVIENFEKGTERLQVFLDTALGPYALKKELPYRVNWSALKVQKMQVFRIVENDNRYEVQDITSQFRCMPNDIGSYCLSLPKKQ